MFNLYGQIIKYAVISVITHVMTSFTGETDKSDTAKSVIFITRLLFI